MPLPMLDERRVQDQSMQPSYVKPSASPEDFGAGVGVQLSRASAELRQVAEEEKRKADAFAAARLQTEFSQQATDLLYNANSGFLTRTGEGALDVAPVLRQMEELRNKIGARARNTDQAQAFEIHSAGKLESLARQAEEHSVTQRQVYYKQTADGQLDNAVEEAALYFNRPESVKQIIEDTRPLMLLQWSANERLPPEQVEKRWRAAQSDILASVLKTYVGKDMGQQGLKFLNDNREALGSRAAEFEARLKPIADRQVAEMTAENIYQNSFGKIEYAPDRPGERWALEELRVQAEEQHLTQDQFNIAEAGIRRRMDAWRGGFNAETVDLFDAARSVWVTAGYNLSAIPEHLRGQLNERGEWFKLVQMDEMWHRQLTEPRPPTMIQRRNMVEFIMKLNAEPHRYDNWTEKDFHNKIGYALHPSDYEQAGLALAMKQGRPEKFGESFKIVMRMAEDMAGGKEINAIPNLRDPDVKKRDPVTWTDEEQVLIYYELQRQVQNWVIDWGKKPHDTATPTQEEFRPFLEELLQKGKDPDGGFFNSKTTLLQARMKDTSFEPDKDSLPPFINQTINEQLAAWPQTHPDQPPPSRQALIRAYFEKTRRINPAKKAAREETRKRLSTMIGTLPGGE